MATTRIIRGKKCHYRHTSLKKGYISRVAPNPEHPTTLGCYKPYFGRFGAGFIELTPNWRSTRYCFVSYWIIVEGQEV